MTATQNSVALGFGGKNDDVETPDEFLEQLQDEFNVEEFFDPCPIRCDLRYYDGLEMDWGKKNFVNPPYSSLPQWLRKAAEQLEKGNESLVLVPMRANRNYWRDFVDPYVREIQMYTCSFTFVGYKNPLPIPLCLLLYGKWEDRDYDFSRCRRELLYPYYVTVT